jgi:hypothetical protein
VRFTLATPVEPSRPKGVGLTALALAALTLIYFAGALLHLFGGTVTASRMVEQFLMFVGRCVVLLSIWNYWKGQNWARIFVLLWSFAFAAKDISALIDRDENLTSLMSQPVRFFHAILAIFLLYFLNTPPLRAWFKRMSATAADLIAEHLVGKLCVAVKQDTAQNHADSLSDSSGDGRASTWHLAFEHDAELTLACPWRIVLDDNLAFASNASGNPVPETAESQPSQLLQNLRVKAVRLAPRTSDLFLSFEMGIELQSWSAAPQARHLHALQWKYSDPTLTVVADSEAVNPQSIATPIPAQDAAKND